MRIAFRPVRDLGSAMLGSRACRPDRDFHGLIQRKKVASDQVRQDRLCMMHERRRGRTRIETLDMKGMGSFIGSETGKEQMMRA
jgi:hypothetical protein